MKIITMYELLGLIKNGKAPKKIKYDGIIWQADYALGDYTDNCQWLFEKYFKERSAKGFINDEIEILEEKEICHKCHKYPAEYNQTYCEFCLGISKLEEEKKIPEKLTDILRVDDLKPPVDENMHKIWCQIIKNQNKINEICDYLKSKGDE